MKKRVNNLAQKFILDNKFIFKKWLQNKKK